MKKRGRELKEKEEEEADLVRAKNRLKEEQYQEEIMVRGKRRVRCGLSDTGVEGTSEGGRGKD